ncbi:MAG: lipopolysaccharide biosynthesis protein [Solirubrobacteraceae bacterium]
MLDHLKRLIKTGAAYQAADILAKGIAVFTLPLYTAHVSSSEYGAYSSLLTAVILASIIVRFGVGEAFVRFYYHDEDPERRRRIAKTTIATVAWTTTLSSALLIAFAGPVSQAVLGHHEPLLLDCAVVGLWAFTNLEIAYAQLRVDERARAYLIASITNVALTVLITVSLVVIGGFGAKGLLLGNFGASGLVVLGLWVALRSRFSLRVRWSDFKAMLSFGAPTVPADAIVYCLQVADRFYLLRFYSASAAGQYAIALQLATVVFVAVRGFQYAWPPVAYSIKSDAAVARLYSLVATWFVLATGVVVAGVALLGRWLVRLLSTAEYFGAHSALPWLALGWTLYGLYQMAIVITGRAGVTRRNIPAATVGLAVNVLLLLWLVPGPAHPGPLPGGGAGLGIAGAGMALCGAYVAMLLVIHTITRRVFRISFEWARLARLTAILGGVAVSGNLLLPTSGATGFIARALWLCLIPALLLLTRFLAPREMVQLRLLLRSARRWRQLAGQLRAR